MTQPDFVKKLFDAFPDAFINGENEIILSVKGNVYFSLNGVERLEDCLKKIFYWCSRDACKSMPYYSDYHNEKFRQRIRNGLNKFIGKDFSKDEWGIIYNELGNEVNPELAMKFIESGLNMSVLESSK